MKYDVCILLFSYRKQNSKRNIWIRKSIRSVKKQKGLKIQFIILDDGSRNKLPSGLLDSTTNVHIEYHRYRKNTGKFNMMKTGLSLCKSDLFTLIGDDDYLPHTRSILKRYLFFKSMPRTALIWTNAYYQRGKKKMVRSKMKGINNRTLWNHRALLDRNYICGMTFLIKTDIMKKCLWDQSLTHGEEWDTWKKVSAYAKKHGFIIRYCPAITGVYRLHKEQNFQEIRNMRKGTK